MAKTKNTPSYVLPSIEERIKDYSFINDLTDGWKTIVKAKETYLPKQQSENNNPDAYNARHALATYLDDFNPTIEGLLGLIFQKESNIVLETNQQELLDIQSNADAQGKDLNHVIKNYFNESLRKGLSFLFVDFNMSAEDAGSVKLARIAKAKGIRPIFKIIKPENIINYKTQNINGQIVLTQLTIKEVIQVDVKDNDFEVEEKTQYRVLRIGEYLLYDDNDNVIDRKPTNINFIPIVPLNLDENGDFMDAMPPFYDLGKLTIAKYQIMSDSRWAANTASIPILMLAGFNAEEAKNIVASVNTAMRSNNPNAKMEYVDYNGNGVDVNLKIIEKIDQKIKEIGMSVTSENKTQVTATEKTLDTIQTQSKLSNWVDSLSKAMVQAFGYAMAYYGKTFEGELTITADILEKELTYNDVNTLSNLEAKEQLSRETLWEILQTKGILPKTFDVDQEKQRIESDVSSFKVSGD